MEKQDTKAEKLGMIGSSNWREEIVWIAGPYKPSDTRESWLNRAARKAGVSLRTVKALFYGERHDPRASVADRVRGAADQARREAAALASRFESIAGGLNATDSDFHRDDIAALIGAARTLRGLDRPGDH